MVTKFHIFLFLLFLLLTTFALHLNSDSHKSLIQAWFVFISVVASCIYFYHSPHPTLMGQTHLGLAFHWVCLNTFFCFSWIMSDCVHLFLSPARTGLLTSSYWNTILILRSPIKSIFCDHPNRTILLLWIIGTQLLHQLSSLVLAFP